MDLVDPFGRTIRDLRISVTDRCNFRCTYCMPEEGMVWLPRSEVLTFEEIERLARIFVERFEVDGLRLTGGEPTVRAHLPVLVGKLAALRVPSTSASPAIRSPQWAPTWSRCPTSTSSIWADGCSCPPSPSRTRCRSGIRSASTVENDEGAVVLRVVDDGVGVDQADLPRLFERFYRADRSRASRGTGLGLAIVKHIGASAGGTVEAHGVRGQGLEIRCLFPSRQ